MSSAPNTRIAVPVCARRADELPGAIERAAPSATFIELRLDCLEAGELAAIVRSLPELPPGDARSFILTLRPAEQGGQRVLNVAERLDFWSTFFSGDQQRPNVLADVEFDLVPLLQQKVVESGAPIDWERVICSWHDFAGAPADLEQLYERMAATPARVLKIAVRALEITDCLPVFRLLERARREGREMIAVAMGEAGLATRVIGPSRGAFLTFGAIDAGHATAPGQVSVAELCELYRIGKLGRETAIVGLAGSPVAHSLSPHVHNAAFAACGLDAVYLPFEVSDVNAFVSRMVHPRTREIDWNLRGLSVTAPHKSAIIESLDVIDTAVREIGAVNTVVAVGDELHGFNTDAGAALAPLVELIEPRGMRVAVLGAGGAARAVLWSLRRHGAVSTVFARRPDAAQSVARQFDARPASIDSAQFGDFDLVVNTTPLGTRGSKESETPATGDQLRGARAVYDLVYNPRETCFMREARAAGCEMVVGGLPMLVAQASTQFALWTGQSAPPGVMREAAEKKLL